MIINGQNYMKTFKCKQKFAEFLMFKKHFPVFNVEGEYYYFVYTDLLRETLEGLPIWTKIANKI